MGAPSTIYRLWITRIDALCSQELCSVYCGLERLHSSTKGDEMLTHDPHSSNQRQKKLLEELVMSLKFGVGTQLWQGRAKVKEATVNEPWYTLGEQLKDCKTSVVVQWSNEVQVLTSWGSFRGRTSSLDKAMCRALNLCKAVSRTNSKDRRGVGGGGGDN